MKHTIRTTVAIVGGGLAGLYAARRLHALGISFQLLEARERLGGRILSANDQGQSSNDGFDLGPSWFWPEMQRGMAALVEELGLATFPQQSEGEVIVERTSREEPKRYQGIPQAPPSMRVAGGTGALITALSEKLPPEALHLSMRVTHATLSHSDVLLTIIARDGAEHEVVAEHVIFALPPRLLASSVAFMPDIDAATAIRWRDTATWMAPHAKFFALYQHPFWREAGLSGTAQSQVGPLIEIHDATTASGTPALFGFLGVGADQRAAIGEDALTRACIKQLARLFGPEAGQPRATLLKDWAADPLTATADDRSPSGHPEPAQAPWVTGAWKGRMFLAGSETSTTAPGYLAGAIAAAEQAVAELHGSRE
ncbi:MAG: FAD-dependent oxidoreductase [Nitrospira sp.]|nr:FAD-dependent oxidoreductase [Nitrospira sp.]MBP6605378.1 FAD-dependent oxidoreductase [Nitrospira sp.]HQY59144.1 FAD-dependent oxidoreductase [Nitrospira sp.]HRA96592.1 FAD-dependent oxidoreductase [Nitrospira sp.]